MENIEKKKVLKETLKMFWISICIGAQMFGSGMAVIPILRSEFIEKRKWITDEELLDIRSISRCLPGAMTVNIISLIGNKKCGIWGGIASAIGVTIVPIISIIIFTILYESISGMQEIQNALVGITICVCALIINSLIDFWKKAIIGKFTLLIFIISFLLYVFTDISIIIIILLMGALNFIFEIFILRRNLNKI